MSKAVFNIILKYKDSRDNLNVTIDSVLRQDYVNFVLFLVDEGSEDGSNFIASAYTDQRIRHANLNETGPMGSTLLVCAGDILYPRLLSTIAKETNNSATVLVSHYLINTEGKPIEQVLYTGKSLLTNTAAYIQDTPPLNSMCTSIEAHYTMAHAESQVSSSYASGIESTYALEQPLLAIRSREKMHSKDSRIASKRLARYYLSLQAAALEACGGNLDNINKYALQRSILLRNLLLNGNLATFISQVYETINLRIGLRKTLSALFKKQSTIKIEAVRRKIKKGDLVL